MSIILHKLFSFVLLFFFVLPFSSSIYNNNQGEKVFLVSGCFSFPNSTFTPKQIVFIIVIVSAFSIGKRKKNEYKRMVCLEWCSKIRTGFMCTEIFTFTDTKTLIEVDHFLRVFFFFTQLKYPVLFSLRGLFTKRSLFFFEKSAEESFSKTVYRFFARYLGSNSDQNHDVGRLKCSRKERF